MHFARSRLLLNAVLLATASFAHAQFTFTNIADSSSSTFSSFGPPSLNAAGLLGFYAELDGGGSGLFTSNGTTTTSIALTSSPIYAGFSSGNSLNSAGRLGFWSFLDSGIQGLFTSDGTTTATITSGGGLANSWNSLNAAGQLGFWRSFGFDALLIGDGTTTTIIARSDNGTYSSLGRAPSLNAAGRLGFYATIQGVGGGMFTSDGTTTTTIALASDATFSSFGDVPSLNAAGQLAFLAHLDEGGIQGLFIGDGTTTTTIALASSPTFSGFGNGPSLNAAGLLGFYALLDADGAGLFTGDGTTTVPVIQTGDELFGSTVTRLSMDREALNDSGQFAFYYTLEDNRYGIALATPVPEPGSAGLLALGALGLLARRRR